MKSLSGLFVFTVFLGLATGLAAQETAPQPVVPAPAPGTFPVTPVNPAANQVTKEKFGDWEKSCVIATGECVINQLAKDAKGNPVAEINIRRLPEGGEAAAGATVITPLGTLLTSGIRIQVDGGRALQYPFGWCTRQGCIAQFGLTENSINSLKLGVVATLTLVAIAQPNSPVLLNLSLSGFTDAYDALPH